MLTMAVLATVGAFVCGFVLCSMFFVGAAADRPRHMSQGIRARRRVVALEEDLPRTLRNRLAK
jgi:hypothetical protein